MPPQVLGSRLPVHPPYHIVGLVAMVHDPSIALVFQVCGKEECLIPVAAPVTSIRVIIMGISFKKITVDNMLQGNRLLINQLLLFPPLAAMSSPILPRIAYQSIPTSLVTRPSSALLNYDDPLFSTSTILF